MTISVSRQQQATFLPIIIIFFLKKEDIYTVPNLLSTFRILITPVLGYLIVTEDFVSSLIFFGVAGVTDMV